MSDKVLMKGNEAAAEAAIRAGCRYFFGYPITPQTEVSAYMAKKMPKIDGVFLQAESEVAAINMVFGAAGAGARAMTSTSSPGFSLKQEGVSYIAGADLPCVILDVVRAGPGLGGIQAAQSDYFQVTKGGGHGDYRLIVLAPSTVQEMATFTALAFDLADKYRNPALVLSDGILGQMMEPIDFDDVEAGFDPSKIRDFSDKPWATTGTNCKRGQNLIKSINTNPVELEQENIERYAKYAEVEKNEKRCETIGVENADVLFVAYGTSARICKNTIELLKKERVTAKLFRPITLWPFPDDALKLAAKNVKAVVVVEMSHGQMIEDVRLNIQDKPIYFSGRSGGMIPLPADIAKVAIDAVSVIKNDGSNTYEGGRE
ncbi:MAG: 3-methyl-2-oxobutanoate dehydrogenase subunit VorB [Clostridiales bacterium]|jgi:2-oxoglutarate ferredoxin oxidoreductase subunit alpha|nr:3-methyl-2-oxobutanoate dehydrogenase subunit VorB [Clostridiales bacterium]